MIESREQCITFLEKIIAVPLEYFTQGKKYIGVASIHEKNVPEFELFSRLCYGLAPYIKIKRDSSLIDLYNKILLEGVNEESPQYFGDLYDFDQKNVELIPLLLVLYLNQDITWETYGEETKKSIIKWFGKVNEVKLIRNNWQFFGLITNSILAKLDSNFKSQAESYWDIINSFYIGDGWYRDGDSQRKDYYIAFGFHFYSLMFVLIEPESPFRDTIVQRSEVFAKSFLLFFDEKGRTIPYGRSLIYRFAHVSFWSLLAVNNIYPIRKEEMKWLILKNLSWWEEQNIFDYSGMLNLGYTYPNQYLTEDYNSWGSPYWALKAFIILLAEDDFFSSGMKPIHYVPFYQSLKGKFIITHGKDDCTLYMCDEGRDYITQSEAKYNRFAYNSKYGFNLCKSMNNLRDSGLESTLAFTKDMKHFVTKEFSISAECHQGYVTHLWEAFEYGLIETTIVPLDGADHVRVHSIKASKPCIALDLGYPQITDKFDQIEVVSEGEIAKFTNSYSSMVIRNIYGNCEFEYYKTSNNLNIYNYLTYVPYCKYSISKGNNQYISLFCENSENLKKYNIHLEKDILIIKTSNRNINIKLGKIIRASHLKKCKQILKGKIRRMIL